MTAEVGGQVLDSGGVVILDSQKIYGGDGAIAHHGSYAYIAGQLTATIDSFLYNPSFAGQQDVFGDPAGPIRKTTAEMRLNDGGFLVGELIRDSRRLPIVMQKLRELP